MYSYKIVSPKIYFKVMVPTILILKYDKILEKYGTTRNTKALKNSLNNF